MSDHIIDVEVSEKWQMCFRGKSEVGSGSLQYKSLKQFLWISN